MHCGGPRSELGRVSLRARPPGPRGRCPRPVVPPFGADTRAIPEHHEQRPCGASSSPRRVSASRGPVLGGAERRNLSGSRGQSRQPGALGSPRVARRPRSREPRGSGSGSLWDPPGRPPSLCASLGLGRGWRGGNTGVLGPWRSRGVPPTPQNYCFRCPWGSFVGESCTPKAHIGLK